MGMDGNIDKAYEWGKMEELEGQYEGDNSFTEEDCGGNINEVEGSLSMLTTKSSSSPIGNETPGFLNLRKDGITTETT